MEKYYKAHWGRWLIVSSVLACLLMIGITVAICWLVPIWWVKVQMLVLTPLTIIPAALFTVRGYIIMENELLVQRLFWNTRIPLQGLVSAQVDLNVLKGKVIRTFGNGGLFSFSGSYYSKSHGHFRAFVTDLKNPVVLRFEKRVIVISPSEPEDFVQRLSHR